MTHLKMRLPKFCINVNCLFFKIKKKIFVKFLHEGWRQGYFTA